MTVMKSETKNDGEAVKARHWKVGLTVDAHILDGMSWFLGRFDGKAAITWPIYQTEKEAIEFCHTMAKNRIRAILYVVHDGGYGKREKTTCFMRGRVFAWDSEDERWYDVEGEEWAEKCGLSKSPIPGQPDAADPCAGN